MIPIAQTKLPPAKSANRFTEKNKKKKILLANIYKRRKNRFTGEKLTKKKKVGCDYTELLF